MFYLTGTTEQNSYNIEKPRQLWGINYFCITINSLKSKNKGRATRLFLCGEQRSRPADVPMLLLPGRRQNGVGKN